LQLTTYLLRIGTPLPPFPEYTHGKPDTGLLPYRTIQDAIDRIPDNAPQHREYMKPFNIPKESFSAHTFAKCITTNGGQNYDPSGYRGSTPRELAEFQMFPMGYLFCGSMTEMKKQIGNAVPPGIWEHYIRSVIKSLEDYDAGRVDMTGAPITQAVPTTEALPTSRTGKRKLHEAIVDLTVDGKAAGVPRESISNGHPYPQSARVIAGTIGPILATSIRRDLRGQSLNNQIDLTGSSKIDSVIDLTDD
jgi:hypothetical protein